MKILEKEKEKLVFMEEIDESLANAIRRSVTEIPVLAIDEVEIYKNDCVLYDEIVANRLGLVPLKMEKGMDFPEECSCKGKGCSKCTIQLKLAVKKPGFVYAGELKGKAEVVFEKTPIAYLREDQEIELVAFARLGRGKEHAKYSPGLAWYRNIAEIEIKDSSAKECVEACPLGLLSFDKKLEVKNIWKCDLCEACVEACKNKGNPDAIKIKPGKDIIFFIESFGQMEAKDIFIQAVDVLKDNLKKVLKA